MVVFESLLTASVIENAGTAYIKAEYALSLQMFIKRVFIWEMHNTALADTKY